LASAVAAGGWPACLRGGSVDAAAERQSKHLCLKAQHALMALSL